MPSCYTASALTLSLASWSIIRLLSAMNSTGRIDCTVYRIFSCPSYSLRTVHTFSGRSCLALACSQCVVVLQGKNTQAPVAKHAYVLVPSLFRQTLGVYANVQSCWGPLEGAPGRAWAKHILSGLQLLATSMQSFSRASPPYCISRRSQACLSRLQEKLAVQQG